MKRLLVLAALMLVALGAAVPAGAGIGAPDGPVPAVSGPCVAPRAAMRRMHMEMLKHDRTLTVHQGVRTPERTLEACVTCHAVAGADGKPVTIADDRHFCNSCHGSAAVTIDCFSCHRSTPPPSSPSGAGARP